MSNYFVDTSALFKRYIPEEGTEKIDDIFKQGGTFYISDITIVGIISNLKRKNEISKELDDAVYKKIKSEFFSDIAAENIKTSSITSRIIIEAINLIDQTYVTPVDSVQLAAALQLKAEQGNMIFICSDKKLGILAEKCGLQSLII